MLLVFTFLSSLLSAPMQLCRMSKDTLVGFGADFTVVWDNLMLLGVVSGFISGTRRYYLHPTGAARLVVALPQRHDKSLASRIAHLSIFHYLSVESLIQCV